MLKQTVATEKTVELAVSAACAELGVTPDEVDYVVLEEPKKGILGFGASDAKVEVTLKSTPAVRAVEFIENLVTDNHLSFCKRWFHLAGIKEFLEDMEEYRRQFMISYSSNGVYTPYYYDKNDKFVVVPVRDNRMYNKIRPISFTNDRKIKPITFYNPREVVKR